LSLPARRALHSDPERSSLAGLIAAVHPAKLWASFLALSLGGALAIGEPGPSRWPVWCAVALAGVLLHAGGRFLVEAAERRRQQALPWQSGRPRSPYSPTALRLAAAACLAAGAFLGFLGVIERGWPLFWMGVVGIAGAIAYSHGIALRDRGLGAPLAFVLFGPLPVTAGYLAVTGDWSGLALRASLPLGFLAAAAVLAREIRDVVDDGRARATTLAGWSRRPLADYLLLALLAAAYGWLAWLVGRGLLAPVNLAPWLTLPLAVGLLRLARSHPEEGSPELGPLPERAARLYALFAFLYALSVAASLIIWRRAA
jgi:1,4-dihydroxy-2-naphthoate octaprenyltransferase